MLVAAIDLSIILLQLSTALTDSNQQTEDVLTPATLGPCRLSAVVSVHPSYSYMHLTSPQCSCRLQGFQRFSQCLISSYSRLEAVGQSALPHQLETVKSPI